MESKQYVTQLVYAAKNSNNSSFEELYNIYYEKIYALCLTTLKNSADAEDALQLTFINAWQKLDELKDNSSFNTWIQRIAVNQCYSILRKKKPDVSVEEEEEIIGNIETEEELTLPGVYAERADLSERLKNVIDGLSDVQRQTILLYYFNQLSIEEIAEVMNCGENTVKSRLMLARRSVKTEIEERERITGEKFFGVASAPLLPFSKMFTAQISKTVIGKQAAATIFKGVSAAVRPTAAAVSTAGKVAATTAKKVAAKAGMSVAKKIVIGAVCTGVAVSGAAGAAYIIGKEDRNIDPGYKKAYISVLTENKDKIDAYTWQKELKTDGESYSDEELSRPVVIEDMFGDKTPELIYVTKNESAGFDSATIHIATCKNGKSKEIYRDEGIHSLVGGGADYYLFNLKGEKNLWICKTARDDWMNKGYYVFKEKKDRLTLDEKYKMYSSPLYDQIEDGALPYKDEYTKNGKEKISEKEYEKAISSIEKKTKKVLLYSQFGGEFALKFVKNSGCPSMTCQEAIDFLSGGKSDASEEELPEPVKFDFNHVWDEYEYATVNALDENGKSVWKYETGKYPSAQMRQVDEIGPYEDKYYFTESGKVVCLNKNTGKKIWETNCIGGGTCFCFDESGTLYITSAEAPHAVKIDAKGKVVWKVGSYGDYYQPNDIKFLSKDVLQISFESGEKIKVDAKTGKMIKDPEPAPSFSSFAGKYLFASGAGGWSTTLKVNADGTFSGNYYDDEYMGEGDYTGEEYRSEFSGKFWELKRINDYTYSCKIQSLTYKNPVGQAEDVYEEWGKMKRIYTEAYGLAKAKTVYLYAKGAPVSELPEEFVKWAIMPQLMKETEKNLTNNGIYNADEEYGFFGTD